MFISGGVSSTRNLRSVQAYRNAVLTSGHLLEDARSLSWRVLLTWNTLDERQWAAKLQDSRDVYDSLHVRYLNALQDPEDVLEDPLSEGSNVSQVLQLWRINCLTLD